MPKYQPLDIAAGVDCLYIDLVSFDWSGRFASFRLPDDQSLRIGFAGEVIIRMLDEFALSTEDRPEERHGVVSGHFAYRVEGDQLVAAQSSAWRESYSDYPLMHYRFITGDGCLDVLSHFEPEIEIGPSAAP